MPNIKPDNRLRTIEAVSKLLDSQFKIGNFRFGLDPILNLIPFAGDTSTALVSVILVYTMRKHGASNQLIVKMLGNVAIDFLLGAIPLFGWIFDFYFKANDKNVSFLKEHYAEGKHSGSAKRLILFSLIIFLLMIAAFIWATWTFTAYLITLFLRN